MPLTKVSGEVIQRPLVITGNTAVTGILTVGVGSTTTTLDGTSSFPTIRPSIDFAFAASKTLDRRISFYRNSIATYTDENGIIRTATNNVPRFDHDPTTGESLGLLIEESRTNLHLHSENVSNWNTETGATVTPDAYISPNGTQTADALNGTMDGSSAYLVTTLSNATTYTFSVFLKYISGVTNIEIQIGDTPFSRSYTTFNVQTGTLVSNAGGTATVNAVQNCGNGWYRYSITRTTTSSGGAFMDINHRTTTPSTVVVWGAQIEAGSFPTSYIPTTTASVTRAADFPSITGTNFSSWYNQNEGTVCSNFRAFNVGVSDGGRIFIIYNSSNLEGNRIDYVVTQSGTYQPYLASGNTVYYDGPATTGFSTNTNYKIAVTVKQDDVQSYINGNLSKSDTTFVLFTADAINIGYTSNTNLNGHISRFTYYPKRLTNDQLQTLTRQ